MTIEGIVLQHKKFGQGKIKEQVGDYLIVSFEERDVKFQYPDAFQKYLSAEDPKADKYFNELLLKKIEQKSKAKEKEDKELNDKLSEIEAARNRQSSQTTKQTEEDLMAEIIKRRKITRMIHFTRVENLKSILEHGLVPISMHEEMKINAIKNDEDRIDQRPECTSLSVEFPNYRVFYSFRNKENNNKEDNNKDWVVLDINPAIILSKDNKSLFYKTNAAASSSKKDADFLKTPKAFEGMFSETVITKDGSEISRNELGLPDKYTTDPQGEVLVQNIIGTQYIREVYFPSLSVKNKYIKENGRQNFSGIEFNVDPALFQPRKDYMFSKEEEHSLNASQRGKEGRET